MTCLLSFCTQSMFSVINSVLFFFFNDTATTEIYTLSLHDALPICQPLKLVRLSAGSPHGSRHNTMPDRKSTRLNSSHPLISSAVFCLKKKQTHTTKAAESCAQAYDRTGAQLTRSV